MHRKYNIASPNPRRLDKVFLASQAKTYKLTARFILPSQAKTLTNQVHNQQEKSSCMKQYDRGNPE